MDSGDNHYHIKLCKEKMHATVYVKMLQCNTYIKTCGLRTSQQKISTLLPKNTRTCFSQAR